MMTQEEQLNNEGVKHFLNGEFKDAKVKYDQALEVKPDYATALNNLGMLWLQEKEFEKAATCFEKANNTSENATYILNLGHAYANRNMIKQAEDCYRKSIELDPNKLIAWKSLAALYQAQKRFVDSATIWNTIIENYSRDPEYKIQLAKDLINLKEFNNALAVLHDAANYDKNIEVTCYYIALVHFNNRNFGLALDAINKSMVVRPDENRFRLLAASIYLGLGQLDRAMMQWDHILHMEADNHKVRTDKAVALLSHNYKDKALKELDYVLLRDKDNIKARFYKALTLIEMKARMDEARKILELLAGGEHAFTARVEQLLQTLRS
ncbi:tetratricopeptide repeat protein [Seonamhaeicola sp.]|uniref:tetratricopeptide repeat protein n=1 Tax=Seonamhaeicola sp. TaxID=1912245 RepID=UPI0026052C93|nr:tetratricopeptide repeat protein [Seonamhaeicola sp.]